MTGTQQKVQFSKILETQNIIFIAFFYVFCTSGTPNRVEGKMDKTVCFLTSGHFLVLLSETVEGFIIELLSHSDLKLLCDSAAGGPVID